MTIPEDTIMTHLDLLLTNSEPGACLHHLIVVSTPAGADGPLGLPDESQMHAAIYAIAASDPEEPAEHLIAQTIRAAAVEAANTGRTVLFAGISQEAWVVQADIDEQARRLQSEGRLSEHPDAVEVTIVYGACRDGRRWRGRRWLTGSKADTTEATELLVGRPHSGEGQGITVAPLIRRLVGIF